MKCFSFLLLLGGTFWGFVSCCGDSPGRSNLLSEQIELEFPWTQSMERNFDRWVDSVQYIPLESHPDGLFRMVDKMIVESGRIFIFDYHARNQVLVFDTTGRFLYPVGRRGKGPGEYTRMRNFTTDTVSVYLIDNDRQRLLRYDIRDGSFISEHPLSFWATDVVRLHNGDFLFAQNLPPEDFADPNQTSRLVLTDSELHLKRRWFPFTDDDNPVEHMTAFQKSDPISFHALLVDTVVLIPPAGIDTSFRLLTVDFGRRAIPRRYRRDWQRSQDYAYISSPPIVTDTYLIGNIQDGSETYTCLYRRADSTVYRGYNDGNEFLSLLCSDSSDAVYTDFQVPEVYHYMISHGWPRASSEVEQRIEAGDYVLIRLTFKP